MIEVPFLDLKASYTEVEVELDAAYKEVMQSGWYVLGDQLTTFEREYSDFCGSELCVGVANGLDALTLSLLACGVGSGDEVIVPSNTYIATWLAVSRIGATPVPVEPDPMTYNITVSGIKPAITPKTKAIIPVHLYGQPADVDAITKLARPLGLKVIEDAAQCHGSALRGRSVGSHGDAVAWSFYPGKI